MNALEKELRDVEDEMEALREKRSDIYRRSLEAPQGEKVCEDFLAEMCAEEHRQEGTFSFPIEISAINWVESEILTFWRSKPPKLVKVRPASDPKTYLGLYVGDLPLGCSASYHPESKVLSLELGHHNPAIIVPSLKKVVFGCESWWGEIKGEEDLRQITDQDIQNVPYVTALRALVQGEK